MLCGKKNLSKLASKTHTKVGFNAIRLVEQGIVVRVVRTPTAAPSADTPQLHVTNILLNPSWLWAAKWSICTLA